MNFYEGLNDDDDVVSLFLFCYPFLLSVHTQC